MKKFQWLALFLTLLGFRDACQSAPVLVLQDQNISQAFNGIVSNGGKWIVEYNQVFEGRTGLRWGEIPTTSNLSPICFTPDATRILMAEKVEPPVDPDYWRVALCEMPSGRKLRWFNKAVYPLWCDNTRFRGVENGTIVELDLRTGRKKSVKIQDTPNASDRPEYAFSENGKFLIEGKSGVIRWWNTASGQLSGRIEDKGRSDNVTGISNDGKWLASQVEVQGYFGSGIIHNLGEGPYQMYLWNASTRKVKYSFKDYGVASFGFTSDSRNLLSLNNGTLHHFEIRTGRDKQDGVSIGIQYVSQDLHWIVGSHSDHIPEVWSIPQEKRVSSFVGPLLKVEKIKWSPDGKFLAELTYDSGTMNNYFVVWDTKMGKVISQVDGANITDFQWVDSTTIRSHTSSSIQLWSAPDLKPKDEWNFALGKDISLVNYYYSAGVSVAPDGLTVLTGDNTGLGKGDEIWVWDANTRKVRHKLKFSTIRLTSTEFDDLFWLADNRRVLIPTKNGFIVLDTLTGKTEREQHDPVDSAYRNEYHTALRPLKISPDRKWLAVFAERNKKVVVFDLKDWSADPSTGSTWWKNLNSRHLSAGASGLAGESSPDGRLIAFTNGNYAYQPDETAALQTTLSDLKGISIWNFSTRREILKFYPVGSEANPQVKGKLLAWIAITPQGYYDASPEGEKHLRWREGNNFWPITKSRARFKRPDMVAKALNP